jgi:hypothetical protein
MGYLFHARSLLVDDKTSHAQRSVSSVAAGPLDVYPGGNQSLS